ncbi:hypothetical protein F5Y16DRAFT_401520 [Xylariaceae sp. FL0255]|nr:hypothetical protein F5Y16DRAFT_401520 [Xylariaceae sp. FL0255]
MTSLIAESECLDLALFFAVAESASENDNQDATTTIETLPSEQYTFRQRHILRESLKTTLGSTVVDAYATYLTKDKHDSNAYADYLVRSLIQEDQLNDPNSDWQDNPPDLDTGKIANAVLETYKTHTRRDAFLRWIPSLMMRSVVWPSSIFTTFIPLWSSSEARCWTALPEGLNHRSISILTLGNISNCLDRRVHAQQELPTAYIFSSSSLRNSFDLIRDKTREAFVKIFEEWEFEEILTFNDFVKAVIT